MDDPSHISADFVKRIEVLGPTSDVTVVYTKDMATLYYVKDGRMRYGRVFVTVEFDFTIHNNFKEAQMLACFFATSANKIPDIIKTMTDRPGTWCLMSSYEIVHVGDLFRTQEEAAHAEYTRLTSDYTQ